MFKTVESRCPVELVLEGVELIAEAGGGAGRGWVELDVVVLGATATVLLLLLLRAIM